MEASVYNFYQAETKQFLGIPMFGFIKNKLKKIYNQVTSKAAALFSRSTVDQAFLDELTELLICADTGVETTKKIIGIIEERLQANKISNPQEVKAIVEQELLSLLSTSTEELTSAPKVLMLVGINGSGKTTFAAKYANHLVQQRKKVLLVAADTFRAAAVDQLREWGERTKIDVFIGQPGQDPASVIFDSCKKFEEESYDHLIIDTAGRLQTKVNLMKELEKMRRGISKKLPGTTIHTWLTVDSMLGQNSFEQAKLFNEATNLDGIILTKLDGTGKGGIIFSITKELHLPIIYVTFGEGLEAIKPFDANEYVKDLFEVD